MLGRQQLTELGELGVEQAGGGATAVGDDAEHALGADRRTGAERQLDRGQSVAAEGLRGLRQRAGRHQHRGRDVAGGGHPLEFADREAESVGGREDDVGALDLDADAGEHRQGVVLAGSDGDLADGLGEQVHRQ